MTDKNTPLSGWKTWFLWLVVSIVGFAGGISAAFALYNWVGESVAMVAFGGIVGIMQWLVLRKFISRSAWWILVNTLGIPIGFVFSNFVLSIKPWDGMLYVDRALDMGVSGLVIGIAQWLMLRNHFRKAGWWILTSALGWAVGGLIALVTILIDMNWSELIELCIIFVIIGIIAGASTGVVFVILRKHPVSPGKKRVSQYLNVLLALCALAILVFVGISERKGSVLANTPDLSTIPSCAELPPLECTGEEAYCSELVQFEPFDGLGYINYPENGETWENQYRSYLRRDFMMAIQYATAKVMCVSQDWEDRPVAVLGLGDMSEADGSIPGTSIGSPGHPQGTHGNGLDIDVAYYQLDIADSWQGSTDSRQEIEGNLLKPVCKHTTFVLESYHCTAPPYLLDPWRTALFIAYMAEYPQLRVIGVDGKIGPLVDEALDQLALAGWVDADLLQEIPFVYEETNQGYGFFRFHHHHMHISMEEK